MDPLNGYVEPVTVFNRVRTMSGTVVPFQAYVGGEVLIIFEKASLPPGLASIAVHGSAYALDPVHDGDEKRYRLGVLEWGLPIDTLYDVDVQKAIDRVETEKLHQYDRTTRNGQKWVGTKAVQPVRRHDPIAMNRIGPNTDGVTSAGFGDAITQK